MKKNGVFLFVISPLVPEIFKIFVLCKLGTDDIIRCDNMNSKQKIENMSASNTAMKLKLSEHVIAYEMHQMVYILMLLATHPVPDCYYAGMVTPVLISSKHCPLPKG